MYINYFFFNLKKCHKLVYYKKLKCDMNTFGTTCQAVKVLWILIISFPHWMIQNASYYLGIVSAGVSDLLNFVIYAFSTKWHYCSLPVIYTEMYNKCFLSCQGLFWYLFLSTNLASSWNMVVHTVHLGYLLFPQRLLACLIFTS